MVENLVEFFVNIFSGISSIPFGKELTIFFISCLPILELRGGILAASLLHVDPVVAFIVCFIGNILPISFILWFITPLFDKLKKWKKIEPFVTKLENKALSKKEKIENVQFWGLLFFVGIPLPGTGAWTGSLIASMIDMDKKKALLASILGVVLAGVIMLVMSYGILGSILG